MAGGSAGTHSSQFFGNSSSSTNLANNTNNNVRRGSSFSITSLGNVGGGDVLNNSVGGLHNSSSGHLDNNSDADIANDRTLRMFKKYLRPRSQPDLTEEETEVTQHRRHRREQRRAVCQSLMRTRAYRTVLTVCSMILLTGASIRDLFSPKAADLVFDVLFCVILIFFLTDMGMRMESELHYFHFSICCSNKVCCCCSTKGKSSASNTFTGIGSFVFWCELVSTMALLYDISWFNPENFRRLNFTMFVNSQGIPTDELTALNQSEPFERDLGLIIVIAKSARAARFIRSGEAVKLASAIQWYALWNIPKRLLRRVCYGRKEPDVVVKGSGALDMEHREPSSDAEDELVGGNDDNVGTERGLGEDAAAQGGGFSQPVNNAIIDADSKTQRRSELKVGNAMRELTGQRVAIGIIFSLVLTAIFTYVEENTIAPATMLVLHNQTAVESFRQPALAAARGSVVNRMFEYEFSDGTVQSFNLPDRKDVTTLRDRETFRISVTGEGRTTSALFDTRNRVRSRAIVSLLSTLFILLIWFFGVTAFAGPVMILVVIPIERMVRLLGMLMLDPLGYQGTTRYRRFVAEESEFTKNTRWTREVLKGMETSFLMSNILRIGSLMQVGFGSAGVDIIRNNLETGQNENMLILDSKGLTVSCIFLFCDIRQFTDATECLREEVFVFTNRIAAVVHSFCHSYGGSANKNVGDAFLLSWLLDEDDSKETQSYIDYDTGVAGRRSDETFTAKHNQADKALWSVVEICISLHYGEFYLSNMSQHAREALLASLSKRSGPVVQMGFGLHAGRAVQGAIGSQRKIDATYVSEAVERAEFLESSTKKYGLQMLMSDSFHRLLQPNTGRRCRKVDQVLMQNDEDDEDDYTSHDIMDLFTFDMDIVAYFKKIANTGGGGLSGRSDGGHESDAESVSDTQRISRKVIRRQSRRLSARGLDADDRSEREFRPANNSLSQTEDVEGEIKAPELVLPVGPKVYKPSNWTSERITKIREPYLDGLFFNAFNSGLQAFYKKDWETAQAKFTAVLEGFDDGPSKYFLDIIIENNGKPPRDFRGYGVAL